MRIRAEYLLLTGLMVVLIAIGSLAMPFGMETLVPGPVVASPLPQSS